MDDIDEDRSNTGLAASSAERRKSDILSDDEPALTASTRDIISGNRLTLKAASLSLCAVRKLSIKYFITDVMNESLRRSKKERKQQ